MKTFPLFLSLFKRTLTVAVVASSVLASTTASAVPVTWNGPTGAAPQWVTPGNWTSGTIPATGDSVVFSNVGSGTNSQVNISRQLTDITFDSLARGYTLTNGGGVLTVGNITNDSANRQILNNNFVLNAGTINSGIAGIALGGALSGSGAVSKAGSGKLEITGPSNSGYTGTLTVNSGTLQLSSGITNGNVVVANGGTLIGATGNSAGFAQSIVVNSGGILSPGDGTPSSYGGFNVGQTSPGTVTLNSGAVSNFAAGASGVNDRVFNSTGTTTFGGALNIRLDQTPINFARLLNGDTWSLFSSGSSTGDFSTVKITISGTDYSFSQMGSTGLWHTTGPITGYDPEYGFVFSTVDATLNLPSSVNVVAGTLYAVPEPSTIVFAGIGIAMFGWSTLTRRRAKIRQQAIETVIA